MGYKEFEKHLNTSLNNRNAKDIEHEAMWEAIETELPKRKKRRFAFWWLTGIVSILLFGYFIQANITSIESQREKSQDSTGQNITNHDGTINESILNVDLAQNSDETVDIVNESIINSTRSVLRNTTKTNTEKQLENVFKKPHSVESKIGPSSHIVLEEYAVEDNKNEANLAETQQNNKDFQNSSVKENIFCLLYTSPSPRDKRQSRMPSSA